MSRWTTIAWLVRAYFRMIPFFAIRARYLNEVRIDSKHCFPALNTYVLAGVALDLALCTRITRFAAPELAFLPQDFVYFLLRRLMSL
jgi:hypothetical protein